MRARRALAASTLAAARSLAGATLRPRPPVMAGDDDGDDRGDKNVAARRGAVPLYLLTADFVPTDVTCTRPPVPRRGRRLLCFALVSDRVSVAAIATMEAPGVYTFMPINKVDPADLAEDGARREASRRRRSRRLVRPPPTQRSSPASTPPSPTPRASVTCSTEQQPVDPVRRLDRLPRRRPGPCRSPSPPTAADAAARDGVAFYVTDVMAYLWEASEPTRATGRDDPPPARGHGRRRASTARRST